MATKLLEMKCSFSDYIQLLMISQAIRGTKVIRNAKMAAKSSKNEMLVFGLLSTSDDQLSNCCNKSCHKCKKNGCQIIQNEMFVFGLHSTFDDWLSNPSDKSCAKCKKKMVKIFMAKLT